MNDTLSWAVAGVAGLGLGAIFFGGLWWTVRTGMCSPRPALWFFASQLLRTSMALAGFALVGLGRWERLLLCLGGFVVARFLVTWLIRPAREAPDGALREAGHAS